MKKLQRYEITSNGIWCKDWGKKVIFITCSWLYLFYEVKVWYVNCFTFFSCKRFKNDFKIIEFNIVRKWFYTKKKKRAGFSQNFRKLYIYSKTRTMSHYLDLHHFPTWNVTNVNPLDIEKVDIPYFLSHSRFPTSFSI